MHGGGNKYKLSHMNKANLEKMRRLPVSISVTDELKAKIGQLIKLKKIAFNLERVMILFLSNTEKSGMVVLFPNVGSSIACIFPLGNVYQSQEMKEIFYSVHYSISGNLLAGV